MVRRNMAKLLAQLNNDLGPVLAHLQQYAPDALADADEGESHADAIDAVRRAALHIAEGQRAVSESEARIAEQLDACFGEEALLSDLAVGDVFRWYGVRFRLADATPSQGHLRVTYLDGDSSADAVYRVGDTGLLPHRAKVAVVERRSQRGAA